MEARVLHAPHEPDGLVGQRRQPAHEVVHQGCGRMASREGNVADESPDRAAALRGAVGAVVGLTDLLGERPERSERREQRDEAAGVLREHPTDHGRRGPPDHRGQEVRLGERGVEVHEPLDARGATDGHTGAERPAPIVHDERESPDAEAIEKLLEVADAVGGPEQHVTRPGRQPAAEVIGHDHPKLVPQAGHEVSEQESPGGIAVQADHDGPRPLVHVVHTVAAHRDEPRGKRIGRPVGEGTPAVDGVGSAHGAIMPRSSAASGGYHSNARNRVLRPLPKAVSSTFSPRWIPFSSTPIASAAGSAADTMLPYRL